MRFTTRIAVQVAVRRNPGSLVVESFRNIVVELRRSRRRFSGRPVPCESPGWCGDCPPHPLPGGALRSVLRPGRTVGCRCRRVRSAAAGAIAVDAVAAHSSHPPWAVGLRCPVRGRVLDSWGCCPPGRLHAAVWGDAEVAPQCLLSLGRGLISLSDSCCGQVVLDVLAEATCSIKRVYLWLASCIASGTPLRVAGAGVVTTCAAQYISHMCWSPVEVEMPRFFRNPPEPCYCTFVLFRWGAALGHVRHVFARPLRSHTHAL